MVWVVSLKQLYSGVLSSLNATGTRLGACCTGCMSGSTLMWYSPSSRPTPSLNTSGCFAISSSLDTGIVLLTACAV